MVAVIERANTEVTAIDGFCGFGGSSQGIHGAGVKVVAAVNHSKLAIECHALNFPDTDHWRADLVDPDSGDYMDPAGLPYADFAWFSPGCTHHSQANAQKLYEKGRQAMLAIFDDDEEFDEVAFAKSERSRVTMSCVLRYVERHRPNVLVVENVVDVCHWGPGRDGSTFQWWLNTLKSFGYEVEPLFLNSQFFPPCPQSRDRVYFVAWKKGNRKPDLDYRPRAYCVSDACGGRHVDAYQSWKPRKPSWPLARWGKWGQQYVYRCEHCHHEVYPAAWPAASAISWENLGTRLGDRDKPLAPQTVERIRRGLAKFRHGPPIVIPAKAVWGVDRSVTDPFTAQTTQQDKALVVGGIVPNRSHNRPTHGIEPAPTAVAGVNNLHLLTEGMTLPVAGNTFVRDNGYARARDLREPMFTQHTSPAFGFAHLPFLTEMRGGGSKVSGQRSVGTPAHAVTAGGLHHGLVTPAMFSKINGSAGDTAWHDVMADPFNTITGRDTTGLVMLPWVEQYQSDPIGVTDQLATVMTHMRHALAMIEPADLTSITDEELAMVRFRMLDPDPELRRVMAFGVDYKLIGNKTQMTAGLGNAVTPPVASWITERCLATLRGEPVLAA